MRSAVIVAAGKGERFNGDKIFLNFCGAPVLLRATLPFLHLCGETIVVVNENDVEKARTLFARRKNRRGGENETAVRLKRA